MTISHKAVRIFGAGEKQWCVMENTDGFEAGSRFSELDLTFGWKNDVWPVGMKVVTSRGGSVLVYKGKKLGWINQFGKQHKFFAPG